MVPYPIWGKELRQHRSLCPKSLRTRDLGLVEITTLVVRTYDNSPLNPPKGGV